MGKKLRAGELEDFNDFNWITKNNNNLRKLFNPILSRTHTLVFYNIHIFKNKKKFKRRLYNS